MGQPYVGEIILVPYNFAPAGWKFCDGQLLPISDSDNEALFNLIGTTYGGNGQTNFALPDLRGRIPIGTGQGSGLAAYVLAEAAGAETITLTVNQTPAHTHALTGTVKCTSGPGNQRTPEGNVHAIEAAGATMPYSSAGPNAVMNGDPVAISSGAVSVTGAGGSQPHDNVQPYLTLNFCISLFGIFPSQ